MLSFIVIRISLWTERFMTDLHHFRSALHIDRVQRVVLASDEVIPSP